MEEAVTVGALVASALSVGGATFVKGFITEGAKDLYGQLRGRLVRLDGYQRPEPVRTGKLVVFP
jgi:hypothetical protein